MGFIIGAGDWGLGDVMARVEALYALLADLCSDQLDWDAVQNKPDFANLYFTKTQVEVLLESYAALNHTHDFADLENIPTTILGYGITDAVTEEQVLELLEQKADLVHQHEVEDINGLAELLLNVGWEIVTALPPVLKEKSLYFVKGSGSSRFKIFITTAGGTPVAVELDAISYQVLSDAMATKQNKLDGDPTYYVKANGDYAPFNKAAIGLGNVANILPEQYPISDLVATALSLKANDSEVLHKNGDETKESGILTFVMSPVVPAATEPQQAVNFGQLVEMTGATRPQLEFEFPTPLTTWIIEHFQNKYPIPIIVIGGFPVTSDYGYPDTNTLIITHVFPQTGSVFIDS